MPDDTLTPEQFARAREIFEAAVERAPAERRAFAAGACAGDEALLREVELMLAGEEETRALLDHSAAPSSATEEGRFPAGLILGERYRILGLLGRGGMGEVYRAFDLKLDQTVALKFLPAAANNNSRLLERFRGEVRVSRQVSHRNVCRVHDIGDADGLAFLSMEYIDGDNLGTLLKQIGRLPADKALEFARRLCAGLAAAHEKGVLHRDLKPANIMIDRRGQLLITDFGLAAAVDAIPGTDIRSGTPAYMSPEQKDGSEVTVRSDIYSLGLVLAEMFTGQKDTKTSSSVKDLDPAVERVIQRCLDPDPRKRPASAIDVARALPGGDPLAEALAAGETPSPGMVAASDDTGTLSVKWAVACLLLVILALPVAVYFATQSNAVGKTAFPFPPDALLARAHALAPRLGYTERVAGESFGFGLLPERDWNDPVMRDQPDNLRAQLAEALPGEVRFRVDQRFTGKETTQLPVRAFEHSLQMDFDPRGRLIALLSVPPERDWGTSGAAHWNALLEAAVDDPSQWTAVEPQLTPAVRFDQRMAWTGKYPHIPQGPIRFEAAAWKGRIVFFKRTGPWSMFLENKRPSIGEGINFSRNTFLFLLLVFVPALHAYRTGRGDITGAGRVAGFIFSISVLMSLLRSNAVAIGALDILEDALPPTVRLGAAYYGLEPFVRKFWPQALISWSRVLRGDFRSPLTAAHILVGSTLGVVLGIFLAAFCILRPAPPGDYRPVVQSLTITGFADNLLQTTRDAIGLPLVVLLVFVLFRALLRRTWLAGLVTLTIPVAANAYLTSDPVLYGLTSVVQFGLFLVIAARYGVLALAVGVFTMRVIVRFPLTTDMSAWYAIFGLLPLLLIFAIALWSFRNALGGRQVFKSEVVV